jgi:hypothetical protein
MTSPRVSPPVSPGAISLKQPAATSTGGVVLRLTGMGCALSPHLGKLFTSTLMPLVPRVLGDTSETSGSQLAAHDAFVMNTSKLRRCWPLFMQSSAGEKHSLTNTLFFMLITTLYSAVSTSTQSSRSPPWRCLSPSFPLRAASILLFLQSGFLLLTMQSLTLHLVFLLHVCFNSLPICTQSRPRSTSGLVVRTAHPVAQDRCILPLAWTRCQHPTHLLNRSAPIYRLRSSLQPLQCGRIYPPCLPECYHVLGRSPRWTCPTQNH